MLNKLTDTLTETVQKRLINPMYGTFLLAFVLWNWDMFYITFFMDEKNILAATGLLKLDYLKETFVHSWLFFYNDWLTYALRLFILPMLTVIFVHFVLCYPDRWITERVAKNNYFGKDAK